MVFASRRRASEGELISQHITNQRGKCSEVDIPRSWKHMVMVRSRELLTQLESGS